MSEPVGEPLWGQMWAANEVNKEDQAWSQEKLRERFRERLLKIVETKLRTTMIGALAAFEEGIGRQLWGHGKPERACTPEELLWRALWHERVRPAVLNNGNNQIRAMQAELGLHDVVWKGYQKVLPVLPEGRENKEEG